MSETVFQGFGQFSRPDIGLISDSFSNLSEIFQSDKRDALRNILIQPETLDLIRGLYEDISREDLRSASGLDRLLLPSLNQLSEVFLDRIPTRLYVNKDYYTPEYTLGSVGSSQVKTDNILIFNGSIQCQGATYREKALDTNSSVFSTSVNRTVAMSTSRASLFNAEQGTGNNVGWFASANYAGGIRVRRRSHVNRVFLPKTSFLQKSEILENPTHAITLNVDNGNTDTTEPVKLLATKNTPLRVFCRMAEGNIKLYFTDSAAPYFYGFQIQPAQQRPNSAPVDFLPVEQVTQNTGSLGPFDVPIDITTTGFQNLYDLYLYLYVNPQKVRGIEFSGIDIKEFPDQKDMGLVGFDNLAIFKVSGGSMTILPLWLKTLDDTLETLDLAGSGDRWRNGSMGWFDIRNSSATVNNISGTGQKPLYTVVSYLTVPKAGTFLNEDGDDWNDDLFEDYVKNAAGRVSSIDNPSSYEYRVFSALKILRLGDRFYGYSPRFDDVFPNLRELSWRQDDNRNYRILWGDLPKMNNNGNILSYDIFGSRASGSITDIGTSTDIADDTLNGDCYVSYYKFRSFNVAGRYGANHNITGFINNPDDGSDWSAWTSNTQSINIRWTQVSIDLQSVEWSSLTSLNAAFSGGAKFDTSINGNFETNPLRLQKLGSLDLYGSSTDGPMASLGTVNDTKQLTKINIGACSGIDPVTEDGIDFLLPSNFAPPRSEGDDHKLTRFYINDFANSYRFRKNDLENLYELVDFRAERENTSSTSMTGRFPIFPLKRFKETDTKSIAIRIERSNFYDLSSLSVSDTNYYFSRDIRTIKAFSQNVSGKGAILPSFEGSSVSQVEYIDVNSSLPSTYPSDWSVASLRDACIFDSDSPTTVSGLSLVTLEPPSTSEEDDKVHKLTGGTALKQKVMVNDSVKNASGDTLATVMSVSDTEIVITNSIPGSLPGTLYFHRQTVDITGWFNSGFSELKQFRAANCRLSGTFSINNGFSKVIDTTFAAVMLQNNLLFGYTTGTLGKIFTGNNRKITVDLSNNNFPITVIKNIINEVVSLDSSTSFNNCLVKLAGNKLNASNVYSNYTQDELFPTTTSAGPDVVVALFRNEQFQVYNEVEVTTEAGLPTTTYVLQGNQSLSVPGQLESGTYYKTKKTETQVSTEDPLGPQFKNLSGIRIDLGFTYISPSTSPVPVSVEFLNSTTRNTSITETGLTALASCPGTVGSGSCWKNSQNQVLKLIT
jgi:hypothetical protein